MSPITPFTPRETVEFSAEDAMLNTWVEDTGVYVTLEPSEPDAASMDAGPDQS